MAHTQRSEMAFARRQRILEAAAEVFAERGFSGAGVNEIARRAGVNKAMLYYHVGDKQKLYEEVVLGFLTQVHHQVRVGIAKAATPVDKLAAVHRAILELALERPNYPRIMLRELSLGGANLPPEVFRQMASLFATTREVVEEGMAAGQFRRVEPVIAHILLIGSVVFFANALRLRDRLGAAGAQLPGLDTVPQAAAQITHILLHGLAAPGQEGVVP